jgi:hypothetical protein
MLHQQLSHNQFQDAITEKLETLIAGGGAASVIGPRMRRRSNQKFAIAKLVA